MQGVLVFASSAARAAAITSPQEGQYSYLKDTNSTEYYDGAAWIAAPIGDITGVTAGTGISGGGTSGTVTITNDMATTITAAGDIVVGTGSGTYDNLPIGTTNQVLTADTTVSPYKVKWATPSSGTPTFVGCRLFNSTNQSIPTNTSTEVTLNSEAFDTNGFHSTTVNTARITIPTGYAGKYLVTASWEWDGGSTTGARELFVRKNGNLALGNANYIGTSPAASYFQNVIFIIDLVVGDYLSMYVQQNSGGNANGQCTQNYTNFSVAYLGA
jgi:hypothetical protein